MSDDEADIQAENKLGERIRELIAPIGGGVPPARATVAMAQAFAYLLWTTQDTHLRHIFDGLVDGILNDLLPPDVAH